MTLEDLIAVFEAKRDNKSCKVNINLHEEINDLENYFSGDGIIHFLKQVANSEPPDFN